MADERFWPIAQVTQGFCTLPQIVDRHAGPFDRQPKSGSRRQISRWLDAEEPADDLVGQLVVFGPANAVDEEVAEQEPGIHRGDEGPWAKFDASHLSRGKLQGGRFGWPIGGSVELKPNRPEIGQFNAGGGSTDEGVTPHR